MKRIFYLVILMACTEPLEFESTSSATYLTVDGYITDNQGIHQIRLTRSASYGSVLEGGNVTPVTNARVFILINDDSVIELLNREDGSYETSNDFIASSGERYSLRIELDEAVYVSSEELLPSKAVVDTAYHEYLAKSVINQNGNAIEKKGLQFYADVTFPNEESCYARWTWEGTFIFRTEFHDQEKPLNCYPTEYGYGFFDTIENTDFSSRSMKGQEVLFEEVDARYRYRYIKGMKLHTLSEGVIPFFKEIQQQVESTGSIFDPTPTSITGNITNINDPSEVVLGYFGVFGESIARTTINAYELPVDPSDSVFNRGDYQNCFVHPDIQVPDYCYDCIHYPNSTYTPPDFW